MGLRQFYPDPTAIVKILLGDQKKIDFHRRARAQKRHDFYTDKLEDHIRARIYLTFDAEEVAKEVARFVPLACANSLQKRIVNEIARGVYAQPIRRKFTGPAAAADEIAYRALSKEMDLDTHMDSLTCLTQNHNDMLGFVRYIPGIGMSLDEITPAQSFVIPHPKKPSIPLAIGYEAKIDLPTGPATHWIVWDDTEYFEVDAAGYRAGPSGAHPFKRIPMVQIHRSARYANFYDGDTGEDLVAATEQVALINALVLKLHKWQGEKTVVAIGGHVGADKTLDAGEIVNLPDVASIQQLDLVTDPGHYLKTKNEIETTAAANHGISRERLNQQGKGGDDNALRERTSSLMRVMGRAEVDLYEIVTVVSRQHPEHRLSGTSTMQPDYPPVNGRVDRMEQLQIRAKEREMGLSNPVKEYREDNWECADDDEARARLTEGSEDFAWWLEIYRRLNIRTDGTSMQPGQDPVENGKMGGRPPVEEMDD